MRTAKLRMRTEVQLEYRRNYYCFTVLVTLQPLSQPERLIFKTKDKFDRNQKNTYTTVYLEDISVNSNIIVIRWLVHFYLVGKITIALSLNFNVLYSVTFLSDDQKVLFSDCGMTVGSFTEEESVFKCCNEYVNGHNV